MHLQREDFRLRKVPGGYRIAQRIGSAWELLADVHASKADALHAIGKYIDGVRERIAATPNHPAVIHARRRGDDESASIYDAAAEVGVSVGEYVSQLVHAGLLLEVPGEPTDQQCEALQQTFPGEIRWHVDHCTCRFIPGPHPDIRELR